MAQGCLQAQLLRRQEAPAFRSIGTAPRDGAVDGFQLRFRLRLIDKLHPVGRHRDGPLVQPHEDGSLAPTPGAMLTVLCGHVLDRVHVQLVVGLP
jgi:hypothetical protein